MRILIWCILPWPQHKYIHLVSNDLESVLKKMFTGSSLRNEWTSLPERPGDVFAQIWGRFLFLDSEVSFVPFAAPFVEYFGWCLSFLYVRNLKTIITSSLRRAEWTGLMSNMRQEPGKRSAERVRNQVTSWPESSGAGEGKAEAELKGCWQGCKSELEIETRDKLMIKSHSIYFLVFHDIMLSSPASWFERII